MSGGAAVGEFYGWYNQRGRAEQWMKARARSSGRGHCRFRRSAVRFQLLALAYKLGNFIRMLAMPKVAEPW
jgi:hypothetical protein